MFTPHDRTNVLFDFRRAEAAVVGAVGLAFDAVQKAFVFGLLGFGFGGWFGRGWGGSGGGAAMGWLVEEKEKEPEVQHCGGWVVAGFNCLVKV